MEGDQVYPSIDRVPSPTAILHQLTTLQSRGRQTSLPDLDCSLVLPEIRNVG